MNTKQNGNDGSSTLKNEEETLVTNFVLIKNKRKVNAG